MVSQPTKWAWGYGKRYLTAVLLMRKLTRQFMNYPGLTISYRERSTTLILIVLPTMWCCTFSLLTMSITKLIFNNFTLTRKRDNISEYDRWIPAFGKAFSSQRLHWVIISKDSSCCFLVPLLHFCASSHTCLTPSPKWFCKLSSSCYNQALHNFVEILIVTLIFKVKVTYYFPTFHN